MRQAERAAARALAQAAAPAPALQGPTLNAVPLGIAASIPLAARRPGTALGCAPAPVPAQQPRGAPAARLLKCNSGVPSSAGPAPGSAHSSAPNALLAAAQPRPQQTALTARRNGDRPPILLEEIDEAYQEGAEASSLELSGGALAAIVVAFTVAVGLGAAAAAWWWGLCTPGLEWLRCCGWCAPCCQLLATWPPGCESEQLFSCLACLCFFCLRLQLRALSHWQQRV